jgi:hypothetical protein
VKRVLVISLFAVLLSVLLYGAEETRAQGLQQFGVRVGWDRVEIYNVYESPILVQYGYTQAPHWTPQSVVLNGKAILQLWFGNYPYNQMWVCAVGACVEFFPQNVNVHAQPFQLYPGFVDVFPVPAQPLPQPPSVPVYNPERCPENGIIGLFDNVPIPGVTPAFSDAQLVVRPVDPTVPLHNIEGELILRGDADNFIGGKWDVLALDYDWPIVQYVQHNNMQVPLSHQFVVETPHGRAMRFSMLAGEGACQAFIHEKAPWFNLGGYTRALSATS